MELRMAKSGFLRTHSATFFSEFLSLPIELLIEERISDIAVWLNSVDGFGLWCSFKFQDSVHENFKNGFCRIFIHFSIIRLFAERCWNFTTHIRAIVNMKFDRQIFAKNITRSPEFIAPFFC